MSEWSSVWWDETGLSACSTDKRRKRSLLLSTRESWRQQPINRLCTHYSTKRVGCPGEVFTRRVAADTCVSPSRTASRRCVQSDTCLLSTSLSARSLCRPSVDRLPQGPHCENLHNGVISQVHTSLDKSSYKLNEMTSDFYLLYFKNIAPTLYSERGEIPEYIWLSFNHRRPTEIVNLFYKSWPQRLSCCMF